MIKCLDPLGVFIILLPGGASWPPCLKIAGDGGISAPLTGPKKDESLFLEPLTGTQASKQGARQQRSKALRQGYAGLPEPRNPGACLVFAWAFTGLPCQIIRTNVGSTFRTLGVGAKKSGLRTEGVAVLACSSPGRQIFEAAWTSKILPRNAPHAKNHGYKLFHFACSKSCRYTMSLQRECY